MSNTLLSAKKAEQMARDLHESMLQAIADGDMSAAREYKEQRDQAIDDYDGLMALLGF